MTTKKSVMRYRLGAMFVAVVGAMLLIGVLNQCEAADRLMFLGEVTHTEGTPAAMYERDLGPFAARVHGWHSLDHGDNYAVAGEYRVRSVFFPCDFAGLGLSWLANRSALNGTNLNFSLSVGCQFERYVVLATHYSHGSKLGIEPNKPNGGWNFVGGGFVW